jgi:hypothetical protein
MTYYYQQGKRADFFLDGPKFVNVSCIRNIPCAARIRWRIILRMAATSAGCGSSRHSVDSRSAFHAWRYISSTAVISEHGAILLFTTKCTTSSFQRERPGEYHHGHCRRTAPDILTAQTRDSATETFLPWSFEDIHASVFEAQVKVSARWGSSTPWRYQPVAECLRAVRVW